MKLTLDAENQADHIETKGKSEETGSLRGSPTVTTTEDRFQPPFATSLSQSLIITRGSFKKILKTVETGSDAVALTEFAILFHERGDEFMARTFLGATGFTPISKFVLYRQDFRQNRFLPVARSRKTLFQPYDSEAISNRCSNR